MLTVYGRFREWKIAAVTVSGSGPYRQEVVEAAIQKGGVVMDNDSRRT